MIIMEEIKVFVYWDHSGDSEFYKTERISVHLGKEFQ